MALPASEIQAALVTALRGNAAVQAALTGAISPNWSIFDNVPVSQAFPYVYVGEVTMAQTGAPTTFSTNGQLVFVTLHIFSQALGFKEIQGVVKAIDNLLNRTPLTLSGFTNFFLLFDTYIPITEKDGLTRHGALKYKLLTQGG